jgi:hypothetical protein
MGMESYTARIAERSSEGTPLEAVNCALTTWPSRKI